MQKNGILNRDIAGVLAKLGHTDRIVIADCGLPIPDEVPCVDLSVRLGEPSFLDVLEVLTFEMETENFIFAEEIKDHNPTLWKELSGRDLPSRLVSHEQFKQELLHAKLIIRTGENTPYANVVLQAGVIF
ncbi:D-ribose pyranase [Salipaludibacillus keqinensis]|uniref:D-ribose pyranase n=1 Tax=Salipaludibacillus keqinensis TaxID=2045207 RepID=A0A323TD93_9BACI|nr:D-ribose pyranase [Salipaludibacillus keqinensis]PYZ92606.1 D-ribose pyranase [Salipaludibacillus keqinensis]